MKQIKELLSNIDFIKSALFTFMFVYLFKTIENIIVKITLILNP